MFTLAISCLTTSYLPWFMDLTPQVPIQYCSLQHQTLLPSPVTSATGCCFCFGSISSFFLELFLHCTVQFSHSFISNCLRPHGLQHARPPCPSPTPGVYPNSCSLSRWHRPTISSSVIPFSSCLQSFPVSGVFQWVSSSHQVAKVLEFQLQHQSFQWTLRTDF